ncbi:hypothetical protein [Pseudomonas proteolytica]|uniref:hypothetical protein n=1 Tax=Pseudomonas proteolytica TaxID=219574 RepID=UPI0021CEB8BA|nr:hypothetical protein [Pseudomonas proteolytica]
MAIAHALCCVIKPASFAEGALNCQRKPFTSLMLQIFNAGHWHDAMRLEFSEPQKGFDGPCRFHYRQDYLVEHLDDIGQGFCSAVSGRFPLEWDVTFLKTAPAFLHDIAPAGAAKRFLLR